MKNTKFVELKCYKMNREWEKHNLSIILQSCDQQNIYTWYWTKSGHHTKTLKNVKTHWVSKWRKIKMTTIWPFPIFITEDKWTHQKSNEWRMSDRTMCSSSKLTDQWSNLNNTQSMSEGIQAILLLIGKKNMYCHGFIRWSFTSSCNPQTQSCRKRSHRQFNEEHDRKRDCQRRQG